jgi:energy-coupling factor transporter ATP-binding protein EcfA2
VPSDDPPPTYVEWLRAYVDAGLDGVVVADHNSHAGIDQAREALRELQSEVRTAKIVIFPGVEITAHGGTHILAIFDPSVDAETVNRVLTLSGFEGTRGRSDQTTRKTVLDVARIVRENGGVCIPAHADRARGIFGIDSRDLDSLVESGLIRAIEVIDDAQLVEAERHGWISVLGSDAHHLTTDGCPPDQEAKAPGTHFTRVKAEALDLEGFRLALTDPGESIQRCRRGGPDPNDVTHAHIDSVTVRHDGAEQTYSFSPWMNCLIGGRGVGKSTLLELIRLALGRSGELQGAVAEEVRRYSPAAEEHERWWRADTEIVVHYLKDGRRLRVRWSGTAPNSEVELWDGASWVRQSGAVADRTPIRVFSQKQVFELASSPQSFLGIVDDMPEIAKDAWGDEYESLKLEFKAERGRLRQLLAEAEKTERIQGQLEDVRGRLERLAAIQATDQYRELTSTEARIGALASAENKARLLEDGLSETASTLRLLGPEVLAGTHYDERSTSFEVAAGLVDQAREVLAAARTAWVDSGQQTVWTERVAELNAWVAEQVGEQQDASEQIGRDRQREAALLAELESAKAATEEADRIQNQIEELMLRIRDKREELFQRRSFFVDSLRAADAMTEVKVFRQGQVEDLEPALRALLSRPDAFDPAFAEDGLAQDLLSANQFVPNYPGAVDSFKRELIKFVAAGRDSTIGRRLRVDNRFFTHVAGLDAFDVATQILLWFPDDRLMVRYRPRHGANFEPVDRGSPGQRTAALLAVILQMGTEPLVLDQPEDDLENKLIRSLVVESLKRIKTERQVIVATHNANIVVTSGAENIVVLEHGTLPIIEAKGTLQSEQVRDAVCLILEGGEDAIRARYRRLIDPT